MIKEKKDAYQNYSISKISLAKLKKKKIFENSKCSGNKYLVCKALKPFTKRAAIFGKAYRARDEPYRTQNEQLRSQSEPYC